MHLYLIGEIAKECHFYACIYNILKVPLFFKKLKQKKEKGDINQKVSKKGYFCYGFIL